MIPVSLENKMVDAVQSRAKERWRILASVIKKQSMDTKRSDVSVRRFSSYNLFSQKRVNIADKTNHDFEWLEFRTYDDHNCQKPLLIRQRSRQVVLQDLTGFDNTGNVCLWPSEEVLAYYMMKNADEFNNTTVCELGAGMTGLAGVVLSAYANPSAVLLTDGNKDSVTNLQTIINHNNSSFGSTLVSSRILIWDVNTQLSDLESQFDYIICADCLFFSDSHRSLLHVIDALLKEHGRAIVMAPHRKGTLTLFCNRAEFYFTVTKIENYDSLVWSRHQDAKLQDSLYDEDLHYPILLILTKRKQ